MNKNKLLILLHVTLYHVCFVVNSYEVTSQGVVSKFGSATLQASFLDQKKKCNNTIKLLTEERGIIYSNTKLVKEDIKYEPGSNCQYVISSNEDRRVRIRFTKFDLEESVDCRYDFVRIHNGMFGYSPFIGRYCGKYKPPEFVSEGRNVHIEFRSDDFVERSGFIVHFEFLYETDKSNIRKDCVYHLTEPEAYVSSKQMHKDFPKIALYGIDCTWIIYRPPEAIGDSQYKILLQFDKIQLPYPNDCYKNSFEAYEGLPSADRLIKQTPHCTNFWSKPVETLEDKLYLHYVTRGSFLRANFTFWYTIVRTGSYCRQGEYPCQRGFCVNRTANCKEKFDQRSRCNIAFRELQCFEFRSAENEITSTTSLYIFGLLALMLMVPYFIVTIFWINITHKMSQIKLKLLDAHDEKMNLELARSALLQTTTIANAEAAATPTPQTPMQQQQHQQPQNIRVTVTGENSETESLDGIPDGSSNKDQDFSSNTNATSSANPNSSNLHVQKLATHNQNYMSLVPVVRRGSYLNINGNVAEPHLLRVSPVFFAQQRRPSTERLPWVERFHFSDASGSNFEEM